MTNESLPPIGPTQGDVPLYPLPALPKGVKKVKPDACTFTSQADDVDVYRSKISSKTYILREGEATGHKHEISAEGVDLYTDKDGTMYLHVKKEATEVVTHQEHKKLVPPPGIYEVGHINEYDPLAEESRRARD